MHCTTVQAVEYAFAVYHVLDPHGGEYLTVRQSQHSLPVLLVLFKLALVATPLTPDLIEITVVKTTLDGLLRIVEKLAVPVEIAILPLPDIVGFA